MKTLSRLSTLMSQLYIAWLIALVTTPLFAQEKAGIISGEVRDAVTKQPLLGANVVVFGTLRGAATDKEGYFVVNSIPVGTYQLKISYIGYQPKTMDDISVAQSRNTTLHVELTPAQIEMEGVTVTGEYFQKPTDYTVSYRTLSPQEIRRSPGSAEDIFRVMQSLPGVATAGGKSAQLIVRGGSPDENLALLDNIEIYNPVHFARTGESMGIISIVNPALLQKVDFLTGGFPVRYGDKMSSVFDMSLREGNKEIFNTDANLNIAGFGVMLDGPLIENSNMVFSLRRGFFDLITSTMNRPAAPSYYDAVGKITYDLNNKNRISLVGFYYLDQIERTGSTKEENVSWNRYDYLTRNDYGAALGVNWRSLISEKAYSLVTASYTSNGWNTLQRTESEPSLMGEDIREDESSLKSELNYQLSSNINLKLGGQFKVINSRNESWSPEDTLRTGTIIPANIISYQPDATIKTALFLQSSFRIIEPLIITTE